METLTGKTRYRVYKPLFKEPVLVLQVEYRYQIRFDRSDIHDLFSDIVEVDEIRWRDAKVEDGIHVR